MLGIKVRLDNQLNKLEQLEVELEEEEIIVDDLRIADQIKSLCIRTQKSKRIAVDYSKVESKAELLHLLAHEHEHLKRPETMYQFDECVYAQKRKERIVENEVIKRLVPYNELRELSAKGYNNYEIAQELEVTEELIRKAIEYYMMKYC